MVFKKKSFFLGLLFLSSFSSLKSQNTTLTLEKLLATVEEHSKQITLEKLNTQISEEQTKQVKSNQFPTLSIYASVEKASNMPIYENGIFSHPAQHDVIHTLYNTGANLYLNIFDGFKAKNEIKLAEISSQISAVNKEKMISATKLKSIHLFIDLHLQKQWKKTMQNDIQDKESELAKIKSIYKAGVILESDVLRAELELSKRRMTLIEIDNGIIVLQQQLNVLLGNADEMNIEPEIDYHKTLFPDVSLEKYLNLALEKNFDTEISHLDVEASQKNLEINKGNYYPKMGLTGSFQFANPQIFFYPYNPSWYSLGLVGIRASYDISSLIHNKHKVEEAKIKVSAENLHHQVLNDDVRTKVYKAFYEYDEALEHEKVSEQNQKYADENARILKNAYFNQTALITDLLDANLIQIKAKFELEQAKMNIVKTYYSLQYVTANL